MRRPALILAAVLGILAVTAAVYAATTGPKPYYFKLTAVAEQASAAGGSTKRHTIRVTHVNGRSRPLFLRVTGLPKGARVAWKLPNGRTLRRARRSVTNRHAGSVVLPAGSRAAHLLITTTAAMREAGYSPRIVASRRSLQRHRTMSARRATQFGAQSLAPAAEPASLPLEVSGDVASPLAPGVTAPIALRLSNPHDFPVKLTRLDIAVDTSGAPCSADMHFAARGPDLSEPLVVPPGASRIEDLVADAGKRPALTMRNLPVNQDACKGVRITLRYDAAATR